MKQVIIAIVTLAFFWLLIGVSKATSPQFTIPNVNITGGAIAGASISATSPTFITPSLGVATATSIATTGSANTLTVAGSATTANTTVTASGSDTNVGITYTTKGTGHHFFATGGGTQVNIFNTAGANSTLNFTGSNGGSPSISTSAGGLSLQPASGMATVTGTLNATTAIQVNGTALLPVLTGTSSSIGGGALLAGACASTTVSITGATTAMAVSASPVTYPGDGNYWNAYVSSANTVTVKICAAIAGTPSASTYNVRVIQ